MKTPLPGFGHPLHKPDDPRTPVLLDLARAEGVAGRHIAALEALGKAVDTAWGKHITINATGAIAAVLSEIGIPVEVMRGFAVITRAAGLVGRWPVPGCVRVRCARLHRPRGESGGHGHGASGDRGRAPGSASPEGETEGVEAC